MYHRYLLVMLLCCCFPGCDRPQRSTPITSRELSAKEIRQYQKLAEAKDISACHLLWDYYHSVAHDEKKADYYRQRFFELVQPEMDEGKGGGRAR